MLNFACTAKARKRTVTLTRPSRDDPLQVEDGDDEDNDDGADDDEDDDGEADDDKDGEIEPFSVQHCWWIRKRFRDLHLQSGSRLQGKRIHLGLNISNPTNSLNHTNVTEYIPGRGDWTEEGRPNP